MDLKELESLFGKGVVVPASNPGYNEDLEVISTGSLSLDRATYIGGIPLGGKATCIIGAESTGKSTLMLNIIRETQKIGKKAILFDTENSLDIKYATTIGVNVDDLLIINPKALLKKNGVKEKDERKVPTGEEWLTLLCSVISSDLFDVVILDSATSLVPASEINAGLGAGQLGRVAAMFSQAYRTLNAALATSKCGFIYTNQWRLSPGKIGDPRTEPLGEALKFLQAMKISLSRSIDKDANGKYGQFVKAEITKSKVGRPYGKAEYYIEFGKGIVEEYEILDLAVEFGFITKSGSWFAIDEETKLQGEDAVVEFLENNSEFTEELKTKVISRLNEAI